MPAEQIVVFKEVPKIERKLEMIIVHESVWESIVSDIFSLITLVGIAAAGWFFDSTVVLSIGLAMFFMMSYRRVRSGEGKSLTIEQARDKLDALEAEFLKRRPKPSVPRADA